jgi:hypothetical protein
MIDGADLAGMADGGAINEEVMQQIWDISKIPLPFQDRIGSEGTGNAYSSWRIDALQAIDLTNAKVDGSDLNAADDTNLGSRVGNHNQTSTKTVKVSTRARESNTIGYSDELAYQVMMRQRELRQDVEAIKLHRQASRADDGASVAGLSASLSSWLTSNTDRGVAGADGGYGATSPQVVDAPTAGNKRAITETIIRNMCESAYNNGGDPSVLMTHPSVQRKISEYMFTATARIAQMQGNTSADSGTGDLTAKGAVNMFLTDFGVHLQFDPNRHQQSYTAADTGEVYDVHGFDPAYLREALLYSYRTEDLAKLGLADQRAIVVDWTLKVLNEAAHFVISDIDPSADMTY